MEAERLTAVVCDDAPGFRALLATMLIAEGVEVVGRGASWEEAERLVGGTRAIDAVIVDLWMPELDLEALSRVRALAPEAALVVVTALDVGEACERIGDRGVDLVLNKLAPPTRTAQAIAERARRRHAAAGRG
ncbi:MAG TPA: response regulator [Solirubrobacteraceae bacterium]|jgi:DNA-binding NarL/FixJ family response regulator|nr:response regulator [Solirubrobacteraceae bacterium]